MEANFIISRMISHNLLIYLYKDVHNMHTYNNKNLHFIECNSYPSLESLYPF